MVSWNDFKVERFPETSRWYVFSRTCWKLGISSNFLLGILPFSSKVKNYERSKPFLLSFEICLYLPSQFISSVSWRRFVFKIGSLLSSLCFDRIHFRLSHFDFLTLLLLFGQLRVDDGEAWKNFEDQKRWNESLLTGCVVHCLACNMTNLFWWGIRMGNFNLSKKYGVMVYEVPVQFQTTDAL